MPPELQSFVDQEIQTGRYRDANDVIRDGLALLKERESHDHARLNELREGIARGISEADRGELEDVDDTIVDRIRIAGQKIFNNSKSNR